MRYQTSIQVLGILLGVSGVLGAAEATASLFKCQNRDGSVRYQETPCEVGNRGTRLETHSPDERSRAYPQQGATWGDVRRAKAQCDETARRSYAESDPRRHQTRLGCMERIDKACKNDKSSSRCRSALRSTGRRVERTRQQRQTRRSGSGDLELSIAKKNCHAWSGADPDYATRRNRGRACEALAAACRADRYGPDCRQRILQLQGR